MLVSGIYWWWNLPTDILYMTMQVDLMGTVSLCLGIVQMFTCMPGVHVTCVFSCLPVRPGVYLRVLLFRGLPVC